MRASVGGVSLLNIFIVFFIIVAFLLTGTVMYYKGYKVNSRIIDAIEKYEGYNEYSAKEIDRLLTSYGYRMTNKNTNCIANNGESNDCLAENGRFEFKVSCSSDAKVDGNNSSSVNARYIKYKVTSYIFIDMPLGLGTIKLPVTTRTNPIYQFTGYENGLGC